MSDMPATQLGVSQNGFTSEALAPSCYRIWASIVGWKETWPEIEAQHANWDNCITKAIKAIDSAIFHQETISFTQLAQALMGWYFRGNPPAWEDRTVVEKVAWQAVARHLANCLDAEPGSIDVESLEPKYAEWANRKLASV